MATADPAARLLRTICRTAVAYLVIGLLVVAVSTASFAPLSGPTWQARAVAAAIEIASWPRVLPKAVATLQASPPDRP